MLKTVEKTVVIERKIHSDGIADDIASRITGKLINFPDLFDPKTGCDDRHAVEYDDMII